MVGPPYPHTDSPSTRLCISCQYGGTHCFGRAPFASCECECTKHTLDPEDFRMDMIALITAEAHNELPLLMQLVGEIEEGKLRKVTLALTKYVVWMIRTAGMDPIETVREAALYWSGGEPDDNDLD